MKKFLVTNIRKSFENKWSNQPKLFGNLSHFTVQIIRQSLKDNLGSAIVDNIMLYSIFCDIRQSLYYADSMDDYFQLTHLVRQKQFPFFQQKESFSPKQTMRITNPNLTEYRRAPVTFFDHTLKHAMKDLIMRPKKRGKKHAQILTTTIDIAMRLTAPESTFRTLVLVNLIQNGLSRLRSGNGRTHFE